MNARFNYVPVIQAMEELHVSRYLFYQWVKDGKLTIKKVGRRSFVSVEQVNKLFEEASETA